MLKRAGVHAKNVVTGDDIRGIFNAEEMNILTPNSEDDAVERMWQRILSGECFWDVVKKTYLSRNLKRSEVKMLIARGLKEAGGRYKGLIDIFNLFKDDYFRFMRFLSEQDLKP